jgi:DNA-binding NarL/FixJ family response regulator
VSAKPLRVVLVDDHAMLLEAMRRQFEADAAFKVVGVADSAAALRELLGKRRTDLVLLDIQLGPESGLDLIPEIQAGHAGVRVVIVSMFDQTIYRDRAFELGADAYVTKGARFADLRQLLLGEPLTPTAAGQIWQRPRREKGSVRMTLTRRELTVIGKLAEGRQVKEVADALGISQSSVGTYLRRAMDKVGVTTRAELFQYAGSLGGIGKG